MRTLIRTAAAAFAAFSISAFATPAFSAPNDINDVNDLHGAYYLRGVREVAAQILLKPDGRFAYALSYGALDQEAHGSWTVKDDIVSLTVDPLPPPSFAWSQDQPLEHEICMGKPDFKFLLAVCLSGPGPSIPSTEFRITAEFTNGLTRTGVPRSGRIYFGERTEPEWKDAKVKRLLMEVPRESVATWIDVPPDHKSAIIELSSGNLAKPPFKEAKLRVIRKTDLPISLLQIDDGDRRRSKMEFEKSTRSQ